LKIIILAFNGLDYRLASKLKTLSQKECGLIDLKGIDILTPIIWASFITGLPPYKHGVTVDKVRELGSKKVRIKSEVKTIFNIPKSYPLWIPSINPHPTYWSKELTNLLIEILKREKNWKEKFKTYEKKLLDIFYSQTKQLIEFLNKDFNLIMAHFNLLDALGDALRELNKMMHYTILTSHFVSNLKNYICKKLKGKHFMLIASDHGVAHQPYAFYSSNIPLNLKNPKITDFYKIILEKHKEN